MLLTERLQQIISLPSEALTALEAVMPLKAYRTGSLLLQPGERNTHLYFVEKGVVRCFYTADEETENGEEGQEITSWLVMEGGFAVSTESFFGGKPSTEYLEVVEDSTLYRLHQDDFFRLRQQHPELMELAYRLTIIYLRTYDFRARLLRLRSPQARYEGFMKLYPGISSRIPLKYVASYLSMTPSTLSRARGVMARNGS